MSRVILLIIGLIISSPVLAWSNYFRFVNNFNVPMTLSIQPTLASVNSTCGDISHIQVNSRSLSCELEFTTTPPHWYSEPGNNGTITLTKQNDPTSYCTYHYDYTYSVVPFSYFDIHSENFSLQGCHGDLHPTEISVVNDHNEALPRPITGSIAINIDAEKAADATESFSQADCGGQGGDNCFIASPDLNTVYVSNGSTLAESLALQTELDRYEALNFEQFIGSHNAAISRHYTHSTAPLNLSYADPDNYLTLTDQLNAGVRQLELDIQWYNNTVTLCHDNKALNPSGTLCDDNDSMSVAINEIKTWVQQNPSALLIIYLDVHNPLTGHVQDLDDVLSVLDPYVFTPAMAMQYYNTSHNTLPAFQLSQADLIQKYKTNIIITNDDDIENVKSSRYVFVAVQNTSSHPLPENGIDTFFASPDSSCVDEKKYVNIKNIFSNDPNHYNLLRLNASRTVLDYVSSVGNMSPNQYVAYFTTQNTANLLSCPINIFSTSMTSYTCEADDCAVHPTDPKLYSFLWSWGLGYPLKTGGSDIAYINSTTRHFENDALVPNNNYHVLCNVPSAQQAPVAPLQWYIASMTLTDVNNAYHLAQTACQNMNPNGVFAVPTTSYWMSDVLNLLNDSIPLLVNYQNLQNIWVPNAIASTFVGSSLTVRP